MVLRVRNQVLEDPHDAEDAFQATFLVLFRQAISIRNWGSLASWLFGVAHRVACRARIEALRRHGHERRYAQQVAGDSYGLENRSESWSEVHEEVALLPEKLRSPIVLCYLKGLTVQAAALELGCPRGTVLSRLAAARERLRDRLSRRGLGLPAGLVAAGLTSSTSDAAMSATLADSLVRTVFSMATDKAAVGTASPTVATLTHGVLNVMRRARLYRIAAAAAALGLATVGAGLLLSGSGQEVRRDVRTRGVAIKSSPLQSVSNADKAGEARQEDTGELIVRAANMSVSPERRDEAFVGVVAINPRTGTWRTIYKGLSFGPISPDGRYMVYSSFGSNLDNSQVGVWVHDLKVQTQARRIFLRYGYPLWSHDGRKVVISVPLGSEQGKFETWRVNLDGTDPTRLPIPETDLVLDCSRDGNWLAARSQGGDPIQRGEVTLVHPDGTGTRSFTASSAKKVVLTTFKLSPDGQRIACAEMTNEGNVYNPRLYIVSIEGQQRREIPIKFEPDTIVTMQWSPDGQRLALELMNRQRRDTSLALLDPDGSNYRSISLPPGSWNLHVCDWQTLTADLRAPEPGSLEISPEARKADTPRSLLRAVLEEYDRAMTVFNEARKIAKTAEERDQIARQKYPQPRAYARRFLELANSAPTEPAAADALVWVVERCFDGPDFAHAIDLLSAHHAANQMVGHVAMTLTLTTSPATEKLFRAIIEKSSSRDINGLACLSLGRYLKNLSETIRRIKEDPEEAQGLKARMSDQGAEVEAFERLVRRDPGGLTKQAEEVLEQAVSEYGDTSGQSGRLAADARQELFEIRELAIDRLAPEIAGEDVDGTPMKLSDFRGKAVCLVFWTSSCTPCREIVGYETSLATSFPHEPLVLIGVNLGDDRDVLKNQIKAAGITFRSWWDARGNNHATGPIASRFNISVYPTIYILDSRGVIRHKFLGAVGRQKLNSIIKPLINSVHGR
jgi:RNA polymerase sigma factor (sigma-70 family)